MTTSPTLLPLRPRVAGQRPASDLPVAERATADALLALGLRVGSADMVGTPRRVAHAYAGLLETGDFPVAKQVAEHLQDRIAPEGVGVVIEAEQTCMSLRGPRAVGARTVTSALVGTMRDDASSRTGFLALTPGRRVAW